MQGALEERLNKIENENLKILSDINSFKEVEEKLDILNLLAIEIKNNTTNVMKKSHDQEKKLKEMSLEADFRLCNTENSINEIEKQIRDTQARFDVRFVETERKIATFSRVTRLSIFVSVIALLLLSFVLL